MKSIRRLLALVIICLPIVGAWSVMAQEAEIPQATIERTAEGYSVPEVLPEGVVQVTFNNQTENSSDVTLARLNEGVTPNDLMSAMSEAGPMGALMMVSLVGGAQLEANASSVVTYDLKPGSYIVLDLGENAPPPSIFTVADDEGEGAAAPRADVQVSLLDFAFSVPLHLTAGEQTWEIQNDGGQWHEMIIIKLEDDTTVSELNELVGQVMSAEDPSSLPVQPVGFMFPISQGERTWLDLNLEVGSYIAICFLPDLASDSGMAHVEHGMIQVFNVAEAAS
jgi:hypothetical protein